MLGASGQQHLSRSFVVVVGLGGVGSHAAAMLLRSGVGRMRLVDFDQVGAEGGIRPLAGWDQVRG